MYIFDAYYYDMEKEVEVIRTIEFSENFFDSEKECYMYAMSRAYDMIGNNEYFSKLVFIAC